MNGFLQSAHNSVAFGRALDAIQDHACNHFLGTGIELILRIPHEVGEFALDLSSTGCIDVLPQVTGMIAIVILHDSGVADSSVGTRSGVNIYAAVCLLHGDGKNEASIDTRFFRGADDGCLQIFVFGRRIATGNEAESFLA